jgi:hypothetical protein
MLGARASLVVAGERALGWLTDQHPRSPGSVVLVLDSNLSRPFRSDDLPPDHLIMLHGTRESMRDILLAAGKAGFTVAWPADDSLPQASRN